MELKLSAGQKDVRVCTGLFPHGGQKVIKLGIFHPGSDGDHLIVKVQIDEVKQAQFDIYGILHIAKVQLYAVSATSCEKSCIVRGSSGNLTFSLSITGAASLASLVDVLTIAWTSVSVAGLTVAT